jgi:SAM-dependent methyltransferase
VAHDYFGEEVAAHYDATEGSFAPEVLEATVAFLAELAGPGTALEFGIGTGRVALPLAARGVPVHGIDLSTPMLDRLRAKPGAEQIGVTVGDFAHAEAPGRYALVYLVFNTINNLTTQAEQVACFRNAAAHLEPGGHFVIEVGVPELQKLPFGEVFRAFAVEPGHVGVDEYDVVEQGLISHHYWTAAGMVRAESMPFRYVWPAELDLMAELAGLSRRERWADWTRAPFTRTSRAHVSVWQKPT